MITLKNTLLSLNVEGLVGTNVQVNNDINVLGASTLNDVTITGDLNIGIHDSGGTTTEITPNITSADTYQSVTWDISGVSNANKDAIDQIIITIVNASAANTFYIDNMRIGGGSVYDIAITTNSTERMRITSDGNVGIGLATPTYKLQVNGQPAANGYTTFTNYSDYRLKENINPLQDSYMSKLMMLNPVTYNYNELTGYDEQTRNRLMTGFVAQELKEVFPEMVGTVTINGTDYYDTNLSNLQLYLLKGIQEQQQQIND
ncbi:MAG: tail fiber domain-containing protein, partial [Magnetococcus sp. XQGC-1]